MRMNKQLEVSILCFVFIASLAVPLSTAAKTSSATWTWIVYLDADNSLNAYATYSLGMMEKVGSTPNLNVVALWDGYYQPANMYKVVKDDLQEVSGFSLNDKEINMGDPAVLKTFVDFTMSKFPAEHYVLVLWDHGNDVSGICWDDTSNDNLTHQEVTEALSGYHIDILAFDACLMTMVEVAYEYSQYNLDIDSMVGSENYVPVAGYPYDTILAA